MMDEEVIIAPKTHKNRTLATPQYAVEIQLFFGHQQLKSLSLVVKLEDFEKINLRLDLLQSHLLKLIQHQVEYLKHARKNSRAHQKTEKNDIDKIYDLLPKISPQQLNLYANLDAYFLHAPLEIKDVLEELIVHKNTHEQKENGHEENHSAIEPLCIASFICQIERPENKLVKFYEKNSIHAEIHKNNKTTKNTHHEEEEMINDSGSVDLSVNSESEESIHYENKSKCQLL